MALLDIFTGNAYKKAAQQTQNYLNNYQQNLTGSLTGGMERGIDALRTGAYNARGILDPALERARGDLTAGAGGGLDFLRDYGSDAVGSVGAGIGQARGDIAGGYGQSRADLSRGYGSSIDTLRSGTREAAGALGAGTGRAAGSYEDAIAAYDPVGAAAGKYGEIAARATNAAMTGEGFKPSAAYNFNLNQGLEAINRRRAAAGELVGGNADREAQDYGAGLASREYQDWRDANQRTAALYAPLEASGVGSAATGRAGTFRGLGDLFTNSGQNLANIINQGARDVSGQQTGLGTGLSTLGTGRANQLASLASTGGLSTADILSKIGTGGSNILTTGGQNLAQLTGQYGLAGAGTETDTAKLIANLISGTGGQQVDLAGKIIPGYTGSIQNQAAAETGGSANTIGALLQGLKFAAGGGIGSTVTGLGSDLTKFGNFIGGKA